MLNPCYSFVSEFWCCKWSTLRSISISHNIIRSSFSYWRSESICWEFSSSSNSCCWRSLFCDIILIYFQHYLTLCVLKKNEIFLFFRLFPSSVLLPGDFSYLLGSRFSPRFVTSFAFRIQIASQICVVSIDLFHFVNCFISYTQTLSFIS